MFYVRILDYSILLTAIHFWINSWNYHLHDHKLIWSIRQSRGHNSKHKRRNFLPRWDLNHFLNCFTHLSWTAPNFYATKSFSKAGCKAQTVWCMAQTVLWNWPLTEVCCPKLKLSLIWYNEAELSIRGEIHRALLSQFYVL